MWMDDDQPTETETVQAENGTAASEKDSAHLNLDEVQGESISKNHQGDSSLSEELSSRLAAVYNVPVQVSAVLGKAELQVNQLLKLGRGAVIELDRKVGEAIDVYVNDRLVARGEVVVVEDRLGITMTEIIKSDIAKVS